MTMRWALLAIVIATVTGCSKYEFNDPTGAKATVIYDHTGTANQITQQLAIQQAAKPPGK